MRFSASVELLAQNAPAGSDARGNDKTSRRPNSIPIISTRSISPSVKGPVMPMESPAVPRAEANSSIDSFKPHPAVSVMSSKQAEAAGDITGGAASRRAVNGGLSPGLCKMRAGYAVRRGKALADRRASRSMRQPRISFMPSAPYDNGMLSL